MSLRKKFTRDDYFDNAMDDYPVTAKALLFVVMCVVGFLSKILWPWHIEDGEKLWNDRRGRMIIMNHVSFFETIVPTVSMWFRGVHVRPVYKSEFDKNGFLRWILPRIGAIPVDRGTADMKAVKRAVKCMKNGECVLVFPEGTRIKSDDQEVEIHDGYALMARMAKVCVQPMAVVGARQIMAGKLIRPFLRVFFKVGDCVEWSEMTAEGRRERTEEMAQTGMERVYQLRDELRAEHPGKE